MKIFISFVGMIKSSGMEFSFLNFYFVLLSFLLFFLREIKDIKQNYLDQYRSILRIIKIRFSMIKNRNTC